jgi:phosphate uptake regulator
LYEFNIQCSIKIENAYKSVRVRIFMGHVIERHPRVQLAGKHSLSITLPKRWCIEQKVTNGDALSIIEKNNSLVITKDELSPAHHPFPIYIDNLEEQSKEYLEQILVGAYISGFNEIILKTEKDDFEHYVKEISSWFTQHTEGPKLTEKSKKIIRFVDNTPHSTEIDKTEIKSMCATIITMLSDVREALSSKDVLLLNGESGVINRDSDLDQLHWLMHRKASQVLIYSVASSTDFSFFMMQNYIISRSLERIGDNAVKMSTHIIALYKIPKCSISQSTIEAINTAIFMSEDILKGMIDAYLLTDSQEILRKTREEYKKMSLLNDLCDKAKCEINSEEKVKILQLSSIVESIQNINEAIGEISITTVNTVIKKAMAKHIQKHINDSQKHVNPSQKTLMDTQKSPI